MISFLNKLAQEFSNRDLKRTCFVFPTRRAAYVFRQSLIKQNEKTLLLPDLFGIRDFVTAVSPLPIAEQLPLLLTLYNVYYEFDNDVSLEKFMPWGEIILHDFNEIDLQLIPAKNLYQRILDLKEIEAGFQMEEEESQQVAEFWKLFSNQELTPLQQTFLTNWEILPKVYNSFKKKLLENKFIYEGMAYRSLAEKPDEHPLLHQWDKIVFAGFYALSNAEEKIIHYLQEKNKAEVFWDVDNYYFEDQNQEAGKYLRKNSLLKNDFSWQGNYFSEVSKDIFITGVPMQETQAKWLGLQIEKDMQQPGFNSTNTVVVLPSESLLMPVLYALPASLQTLNITMGYPVKQSNIYSLLILFLQLHHSADKKENKIAFVSSQLALFIQHPLMVNHVSDDLLNLITHSNSAYLSNASLKTNDDLLNECFKPILQHESLFTSLIRITTLLRKKQSDEFNQQVLDFVINELEKIDQHIQPYIKELNLALLISLVSDQLRTLKIPFTGEPISGVQIMGFLETRVLDFERVYILSVNEDNLPSSARGKSYIPYSLRKSFGLPVQDDQDAVYAYHFYRLLQRAKQVHLIYNTEVKSSTGGEKSRYLLQLAQEAAAKTKGNVRVHFQQVNVPVQAIKESSIAITKTEDIIATMRNKYLQHEGDDSKGFSASALNDYLQCSLKFYYKQIAGIKEPEEDKTELSPDVFGKIFHKSMQLLYAEHTVLDKDLLKAFEVKINDTVEKALELEFKRKVTGGNDYLLLQIIKELVKQVLRADEKDVPFLLIDLEKEQFTTLSIPGIGEIKLRGFFDRVDEQQGIVRIIDYKTGAYRISNKELIEKIYSDNNYKAAFQLLLYAFIWQKKNPAAQIKVGIFPLQKTTQGIDFINNAVIDATLLNAFTEKLTILIQQIFNTQETFTKTADIQRCVYCEFKNICQR